MSSKPIKKYDYAIPDYFYENSSDFADYIGDEQKGDDRKEDIKRLAEVLHDLFSSTRKARRWCIKATMPCRSSRRRGLLLSATQPVRLRLTMYWNLRPAGRCGLSARIRTCNPPAA